MNRDWIARPYELNYQLLQMPPVWKLMANASTKPTLMYKKIITNLGVLNPYARKLLLIMRLTTVILLATLLQVSAAGFAQRITLVRKKATLESVLKDIPSKVAMHSYTIKPS